MRKWIVIIFLMLISSLAGKSQISNQQAVVSENNIIITFDALRDLDKIKLSYSVDNGKTFLIPLSISGDLSDIKEGNGKQIIWNVFKDVDNCTSDNFIAHMEAVYTLQFGSFIDKRDNKTYKTIKIGKIEIMSENLAYLPKVCSASKDCGYWVYGYEGSSKKEAQNIENYTTYGVLYNWKVANKVCPTGWHLPSETEYETILSFIGKDTDPFLNKGSSGFSALLSGWRDYRGSFDFIGNRATFWSSSMEEDIGAKMFNKPTPVDEIDGKYLIIKKDPDDIHVGTIFKTFGNSVRCIRDQK